MLIRYLLNWLLALLPTSGFFTLKNFVLSLCHIAVEGGVCVNGHTWFYGRGRVNIGENTWVGPRCRFYTNSSVTISIGKNCDIAPEVAFVTGGHEIGSKNRRAGQGYCKSIIVEDGCWIGARVTILGGVTIGKGSVIGSGSLVNKSVPVNSIMAGVPVKLIRGLKDN